MCYYSPYDSKFERDQNNPILNPIDKKGKAGVIRRFGKSPIFGCSVLPHIRLQHTQLLTARRARCLPLAGYTVSRTTVNSNFIVEADLFI